MALRKKTTQKSTDSAVEEKDAKPSAKKAKVTSSFDALAVLKRPMLSEKTTMQESGGQYTFEVAMTANKVEVKKAISTVYGVTPVRVNMIHVEGKRQQRGRTRGRRNDFKKAIVFLPKGKKIDIHEGV